MRNDWGAWVRDRTGSSVVQVAVSLLLAFAFAFPLAALLLAFQNPDGSPEWLLATFGVTGGTVNYTTLSVLLVALVALWLVTSGATSMIRARQVARELAALSREMDRALSGANDGKTIRASKQRLTIERQLIESHYSLLVVAARNVVFVVVVWVVSPWPLAGAMTLGQAYLAWAGWRRYRTGVDAYSQFAALNARATGRDAEAAVITDFAEWLGSWERSVSALPLRDYVLVTALIAGAVAVQLSMNSAVPTWAHGIPAVGVWAATAFDTSRALAHYGFSVARWGGSLRGVTF